MKPASVITAGVVCFPVATACGPREDESTRNVRGTSIPDREARLVVERGCVTAGEGALTLTDLEAIGDAPSVTEPYYLIGNTDELKKFVGKRVEVHGLADPPKMAVVREFSRTTKATGTGGTSFWRGPEPGEPKVTSVEEVRFAIRNLHAQTLRPTGDPCEAEKR